MLLKNAQSYSEFTSLHNLFYCVAIIHKLHTQAIPHSKL